MKKYTYSFLLLITFFSSCTLKCFTLLEHTTNTKERYLYTLLEGSWISAYNNGIEYEKMEAGHTLIISEDSVIHNGITYQIDIKHDFFYTGEFLGDFYFNYTLNPVISYNGEQEIRKFAPNTFYIVLSHISDLYIAIPIEDIEVFKKNIQKLKYNNKTNNPLKCSIGKQTREDIYNPQLYFLYN